jgi:putative tricarboxylic transport membrane protein
MSEASEGSGGGPVHRNVEMGVAVVCGLFAMLIMAGSLKVGINWGVEGPKSGFFPFYVGLIILIASGLILAQVMISPRSGKLFADWAQLRSVISVVIPTAIYVVTLPYLGIYFTSAVLIGAFMKVLGKYAWGITLAVSLGVPLVTYLMFEKWFLVPLPKGPLEGWLGL